MFNFSSSLQNKQKTVSVFHNKQEITAQDIWIEKQGHTWGERTCLILNFLNT